MYDPTVGHWLSEDPIGFEGEDTNLRRYVGNSPTISTDPTGLQEAEMPAPALPIFPHQPKIIHLTIYAGHFREIIRALEELDGFYGGDAGENKFGIVGCFGAQAEKKLIDLFGKDSLIPGRVRDGKLLSFKNAPDYLKEEFQNAQKYAEELIKDGKADIVIIDIILFPDFESLLRTGMAGTDPNTYPITPFQRSLCDGRHRDKKGDRRRDIFVRDGITVPPELLEPPVQRPSPNIPPRP